MRKQPTLLLENLIRNRNIDTKKLHERAAEVTWQRLLLAAMEAFSKKGYHNSNIRDLAKEAGVTKGAFYHHFRDKKDIFISANRWRQGYTTEVLRNALSGQEDFFEGLRKGFHELFRILHRNPMIRGLVREYMAMAMTDQDVNKMYRQNDAELIELLRGELKRHFPGLSTGKRTSLLQRFYVSLEGLFTVLIVGSPILTTPERMLDGLLESFRQEAMQ